MFSIDEINYILGMFGFNERILSVRLLQGADKNRGKLHFIYLVVTKNKSLVFKITKEDEYSRETIENQSIFAMYLYSNGIPTAKKFKCCDNYCLNYRKNGLSLCVTLEEYAGDDIKYIDKIIFNYFPALLAQIHTLSENYKSKIGFSMTFDAISSGKAKYKNILSKANPKIPLVAEIDRAAILHDKLVLKLYYILNELPQGPVHGDLGLYNNIVISNNNISIIDFHMSCDEVYIIDLMASYYSSVYAHNSDNKTYKIPSLSTFLNVYNTYRNFNKAEKRYLHLVSSLMNGIFYTKKIIYLWNKGRCTVDPQSFKNICDIFESCDKD